MVRLRATITWEYDADPEHYGTSDPLEMAAIDAVPENLIAGAELESNVEFRVEPVPMREESREHR